jgi:hypothetical protein
MTGLGRLRLAYGHLRRLPLAGAVVTRLVRATRPFWTRLLRFDRTADEIHLLTAVVRDLSAEIDRLGAEQVEEVTIDLMEADRSGLMARIEACPPAGLAAATIPLSGRETPEVLGALASKLVRAMEAHAVLCLRLLDHLSLFLLRPREGVGTGAMQVSPELVRDIFEHQGCRLVGLRRGGAGVVPTLDLILEMRET